MYEQVFNFNSRPFTTTPYARHYFAAGSMHQAIGQANICVERGSGPVVAIGDIGVGKSLFLEMLQVHFQNQFVVVTIACSRDNTRREFLQNILFQLGRPTDAGADAELRFSVVEAAAPSESCPNGILLLVDDAEVLSSEIFDELRLLVNFVVDGVPRVRAVLAGQKSLEDRLAQPEIASFSQRIASRVFLQNLSREETNQYVVEHVDRVGGAGGIMFPPETNAKVHELTDGCPRQINQVCDFVLILAGTRGLQSVSPRLIEEAWADVQSLPGAGGFSPEAPTADMPSDWTVIEFGQLDDEGGISEAVWGESHAEPAVEMGVAPFEPATPAADFHSESNVAETGPSETTSDLGIDLAALQAMRDSHAAKTNQANAVGHESQEAFTGTTSTTESSDVSAAVPSEEVGNENLAASSSGNSMSEIQSQLAAVFGSMSSQTEQAPVEPVPAQQSPQENYSLEANQTETPSSIEQFDGQISAPSHFDAQGVPAQAGAESSEAPVSPIAPATVPAETVIDDFVPASAALDGSNFQSLSADQPVAEERAVRSTHAEAADNDPLAEFQASLAQLRSGDQAAWSDTPVSEEENRSLPELTSEATPSHDAGQIEPVDSAAVSENVSFDSVAHNVVSVGDPTSDNQPEFSSMPVEEASGQLPSQSSMEAGTMAPTTENNFDIQPLESTPPELPARSIVGTADTHQQGARYNSANPESHSDDPFAESFAEVETVADRFAPEIAVQNQNALEITSADLKHVQPLPEQEASASYENIAGPTVDPEMQSEQVPSTPSAGVHPGLDSVPDAGGEIQKQFVHSTDPGSTIPSGVNWIKEILPDVSGLSQESPIAAQGAVSPESSEPQEAALTTVEDFNVTSSVEAPEELLRQETVDEELTEKLKANTPLRGFTISLPTDAGTPIDDEAAAGLSNDVPEQLVTGLESVENQAFEQNRNTATEDIQSSEQNPPASQSDTNAGFAFVQPTYEWKPPASVKPTEPSVLQTRSNAEPVVPSLPLGDEARPQASAVKAEEKVNQPPKQFRKAHLNEAASEEISRQADEILKRLEQANLLDEEIGTGPGDAVEDQDSGIQILDEIRQQQQMVAGVQQSDASVMPGLHVESPAENDASQSPGVVPMVPRAEHADDSEMLVVKQPVDSSTTIESPRNVNEIPCLGDQVSKGRAQRMNYEQLFDRLRDIPETE